MKIPLGFTQIALTNAAALGLGSGSLGAIPAGVTFCEMTVDGNDVNLRDDGTDPTSGNGETVIKATSLVPYVYTGPVKKVRVIGKAGAATLNVSFYGVRSKQ
jgi:hypothetical protein